MRASIVFCFILAALVAACAGAPKLAMPDGRQRQPINTEAAIEAHKARMAEDEANYGARSAFARQLEGFKHEISEIKAMLGAIDTGTQHGKRASRLAVSAASTAAPGTPLVTHAQRTAVTGTESIEVRPQSITFRLSHGESQTSFQASAPFKRFLLQAAKQAAQIEIRGRTDGTGGGEANQRVATARASAARQYLIAQGVSPTKIRTSALGSGGYLTDNTTLVGKATNRRVEIEAMDFDTSSFAIAATTSGDAP
jgi:outer membrane protein OmpA-like peptidoglycan-associated protein